MIKITYSTHRPHLLHPLPPSQTFWEQRDNGEQFTPTRKFLMVVPVVLFLLACNGTDYRRQPLGINIAVVTVLLVAKLACMHRVRILGINKY